jgi:small subunit ribosomal protein S3
VVRRTVSEGEIIIFTSKLGVIMGKDGSKIQIFQNDLNKRFKTDLKIVVKDVRNPELSAKIMAEFIASQIEARMPYRKVAKTTLLKVMEK